jgi:hypothetical protein
MNNLQKVLAVLKTYPLGIGLVVLALLMAGWTFLFREDQLGLGLVQTLDQAQQDCDALKESLSVVNKNIIAGHSLVIDKDHPERPSDVDEEKVDLKKFDDALIDPADVITNQAFFYDFEKSTGVKIIDPSPGVTERFTKEPAGPVGVSTTIFTLGAIGDWSQVMGFLYGLQTSPHLLRVNRIQLEKSKESVAGRADVKLLSVSLEVELLGK